MKSGPKALLITTLLIASTLALTWVGGILYWHFRLRSAQRTFEKNCVHSGASEDAESDYWDSQQRLLLGGCRSLPYLVDSLDETKDQAYLIMATFSIVWITTFPGLPVMGEASTPTLESRTAAWGIRGEDSVEVRRLKCLRIRTWWKEHGAEYHQAWRFWTANCRGD